MVFPFLFLLEAIGWLQWEDSGWGPDGANPVAADDREHYDYPYQNQLLMLMLLFASVFGGLHFITWSFPMPTVIELWMWRSASIALTSLPILSLPGILAWEFLERYYSDSILNLMSTLSVAFWALHPVIRLVIAVDSVVLLRSLPDTAYLVLSWSDAIPSL